MNTATSRLALALCASLCAQASAATLSEAQAKTYFSTARLRADGSVDGAANVAILVPNPAGDARLELWRKGASGYELIASAPKAGCQDCSGPTHKPNPTAIGIENGSLRVEYQGGGSGMGFWAWRSSWAWDPTLGSLRAVATQRIGADEQGEARHAMVNFIEGSRTQRLRADGGLKATACRAAIARSPSFSALSLGSLFDGDLEPGCQSGTETGDPLASAPPPGSGALDNLMRSSAPAPTTGPVARR